jgi:hypothetical protein
MLRKLTLSFILTVTAIVASNSSYATIYVYDGVTPLPNPLNLNNGDSLHIAAGTFTGQVSGLNSNTIKISVAGGATFQPSLLSPTNGIVCKMYNYGTFTYTQPLTTNTNFIFNNYAGGIVNLAAMNTKGKDQVWTNNIGGIMNFSGAVLVNGGTLADDNNIFINYETVNANAGFQMNSGSKFYNYKDFNVTGTFQVNGGLVHNYGKLAITGNVLMNNGASSIHNYCRMEVTNGINNTSGNFYNYSYLRAINSDITNSANIFNLRISNFGSPLSQPMIEGRNFFQSGSGSMTGPALLYFTGTTSMTNGTIGVPGVTTDTIKMNDITRTRPTEILDVQSGGTIHPNVIYNAWGVPDPSYVFLFGCSIEMFLEIPLAINWNHFTVNLFDNVPVLNWSAEFSGGTTFEIQRSYDGRNFSTITDMSYEVGRSEYEYMDKLVNTQAPIVYYRIKSNEINGAEKYTNIRTVKFSNKPGSIHTAPNPFTNNFIITYNAPAKETITIRLFNVSGQQMLTKNVTVNSGDNRINMTEAAQLAKGIYVIQVSRGYDMISSGKIIKQ